MKLAVAGIALVVGVSLWYLLATREAEAPRPELDAPTSSGGAAAQEPLPHVAREERPADKASDAGAARGETKPSSEGAPSIASKSVQVRGRTTDDRGEPVAGAILVFARGDGLQFVRAGTSDAEGRFTVLWQPGRARLGAYAAGHAPAEPVVLAKEPDEIASAEHVLVLARGGAAVAGRVVDGQGRGVAGAEVQAKLALPRPPNAPFPVLAQSAEDGKFRIEGAAAGISWIGASAEGYAPGWTKAEVPSLGEIYVEVLLPQPVTIRGTVADESGKSLAGVAVYAMARVIPDETFPIAFAKADEAGRYEIAGLRPGEIRLRAELRELGLVEVERTTQAGETLEWNAVIAKGPTIRARLLDASGAPAAGWHVQPYDPRFRSAPPEADTDAEGRFEIANVREWGYTLRFSRAGAGKLPHFQIEDVRPSNEEHVLRVPPHAAQRGRVSGRVLDLAGRSLEAAPSLTLTLEPNVKAEIAWDPATDSFASGDLPLGTYVLRIAAAGRGTLMRRFELAEGLQDFGTLELARAGAVRLALRGEAKPDHLFFYLLDDERGTRTTGRAEGTDVLFRDLAPGTFTLRADPRPFAKDGEWEYHGFGALDREVAVREGEETKIELPVLRTTRVVLRLALAEDDAVRGAVVSVRRAEGGEIVRRLSITRYGREALEHSLPLPPGEWIASFELEGGRTAGARFRVEDALPAAQEVPMAFSG